MLLEVKSMTVCLGKNAGTTKTERERCWMQDDVGTNQWWSNPAILKQKSSGEVSAGIHSRLVESLSGE